MTREKIKKGKKVLASSIKQEYSNSIKRAKTNLIDALKNKITIKKKLQVDLVM